MLAKYSNTCIFCERLIMYVGFLRHLFYAISDNLSLPHPTILYHPIYHHQHQPQSGGETEIGPLTLQMRMHNVFMVKTHPHGAQIKIPYHATCQTLGNSKYQPFFYKNWLNFLKSVLVEVGSPFYHQKMRNVRLFSENFKPQMKK